jgi:hypothetical protein
MQFEVTSKFPRIFCLLNSSQNSPSKPGGQSHIPPMQVALFWHTIISHGSSLQEAINNIESKNRTEVTPCFFKLINFCCLNFSFSFPIE